MASFQGRRTSREDTKKLAPILHCNVCKHCAALPVFGVSEARVVGLELCASVQDPVNKNVLQFSCVFIGGPRKTKLSSSISSSRQALKATPGPWAYQVSDGAREPGRVLRRGVGIKHDGLALQVVMQLLDDAADLFWLVSGRDKELVLVLGLLGWPRLNVLQRDVVALHVDRVRKHC